MNMKAGDLKAFKKRLLSIRLELNDEVSKITKEMINKTSKDSSGDLSGYSIHMADQASDNYDRDVSLDLAQKEQNILHLIDEAVKRVDEKTYGQCTGCLRMISKLRLKALPWAELCIQCQEAQEKKK
jgi:DnaK suppressor protein